MDRDKTVRAVFREKEQPGDQASHIVNGINFNMRLAPFSANKGREGGDWVIGNNGGPPTFRKNKPVTEVSWYDSIVWANSLSDMLGYEPVYTQNGAVIKNATGVVYTDVVAEDKDGFRLPTSLERELSARYKGRDSSHGAIEFPLGSGQYWTPGNYASGATADYSTGAATQMAAWYSPISGEKTRDVGQKPSYGKGLGIGHERKYMGVALHSARALPGRARRHLFAYNFHLQVGTFASNDPSSIMRSAGLRLMRTDQ